MVEGQKSLCRGISGLRMAFCAGAIALLGVVVAPSETVKADNPTGDITIRSVMGIAETEVHVSVAGRARRPDDVRLTRAAGRLAVECRPSDGARVNVEVIVPHTARVEASTRNGSIAASGLLRDAELTTDTGSLRLTGPWNIMRLRVACQARPLHVVKESMGGLFLQSRQVGPLWLLADGFIPLIENRAQTPRTGELRSFAGMLFDRVPPRLSTYGEVRVFAVSPPLLEIRNEKVAPDSWIRPPIQAPKILNSLLPRAGGNARRDDPPAQRRQAAMAFLAPGTPTFVSNVRMVMLAAPVHDGTGQAVTGLNRGDFEVLEDGVRQEVASAGSEQLPFNLVLLLDMSASTLDHRAEMLEAARSFVKIAGPRDRVAVYALADTLFQVISPLTRDHQRLERLIADLPATGGDTPLYDSIAMAYGQEFLGDLPDRTAVVVITDGMDLSLSPGYVSASWASPRQRGGAAAFSGGSVVPFRILGGAVARMPVQIYPILLPAAGLRAAKDHDMAAAAADHMLELAEASGGRLFRAGSLLDLDPVYSLVARELRGVYAISYYPKNQIADGRWRKVEVRVNRPGLVLRTRNGYFAR